MTMMNVDNFVFGLCAVAIISVAGCTVASGGCQSENAIHERAEVEKLRIERGFDFQKACQDLDSRLRKLESVAPTRVSTSR
jgi:hypothetical protein